MFSFKAKLCHQHSARMSYCLVLPEPWVSTKLRFCSERRTYSKWNFSCREGKEGSGEKKRLENKKMCATRELLKGKQSRFRRIFCDTWMRLWRWYTGWGGQWIENRASNVPTRTLITSEPSPPSLKMGSCADCLDLVLNSQADMWVREGADSLLCSPSGCWHTLYVYQWACKGDGVIQGDR